MYVYNLQYDGLYRRHLQDDPLYNRCFIRNNTEKTVSTTVQLKTITARMILHCCSSRGAAEKCSLRTRLPNTLLQLINSFFFSLLLLFYGRSIYHGAGLVFGISALQ